MISESAPAPAGFKANSDRHLYVDLFRGLLMAHMALDHASLFFNPGKFGNELASGPMPMPTSLWQFLARFTGVFVAPGFSFMAGFMVAVTSASREERGRDAWDVTRKLIVRGLVLIGAEALVFSLPFGQFRFEVLSCLGTCLIIVALLRRLPSTVLAPIAIGIMALHSRFELGGLPDWLRAVLHDPHPMKYKGFFKVLYPVFPWVGVMLFGLVVGRETSRRARPIPIWLTLSAVFAALFFVVRLTGWGNAWPHSGIGDVTFWIFAKYPPDLPWLTFSLAVIFALLAFLKSQQDRAWIHVLDPIRTIGRVPFFFYLVHFIVLFLATLPCPRDPKHPDGPVPVGLLGAGAIWLALLFAMLWPCAWYYRMKSERPNVVTRYL